MELPNKLKLIRTLKNWTQEEVADKLDISSHAYAKMERGEMDINFSRLQKIAEVMDIGLLQLFGLDEKNVFNLMGDQNGDHNNQCIDNNWNINSLSNDQMEYKHQLEKFYLMLEQQQKEIDYLKQQINDLRNIIHLLNKQKNLE
jgi:transcriptional regulator with XRE-family HTH domain